MKTYNWALLGCGKIAQKFAEDLKQLPNAVLYATAARDAENAEKFARKYGFEKSYGSYEAMLADPNVDVVYISTPHSFHHQHTIMCLNAGKAVLCEKPFAINSAQVAEMIACARKNQVFLMEAFWTRFLPHFKIALGLIQSGKFGELKFVNANFSFAADFIPEGRLFNPALGGGSLLDVGIYPVFFTLVSLGKPIEIKTMATYGPTGVEESILIQFRYAGNKLASLMSGITTRATSHTEYCFEKGYVRINKGAFSPTTISVMNPGEYTEHFVEVPAFEGYGYFHEAAHVMDCLDKNLIESDVLPFSFSEDLMEILDKVREVEGIKFPMEFM